VIICVTETKIHTETRMRSESAYIRQVNFFYNYYGLQILVCILPARLQVRILHVAATAMAQQNGHFACYTCYIFLHFLYTPTSILKLTISSETNKTTLPTISCLHGNNVNFSHTSRIHFSANNTSFHPLKRMGLNAHRQKDTQIHKS